MVDAFAISDQSFGTTMPAFDRPPVFARPARAMTPLTAIRVVAAGTGASDSHADARAISSSGAASVSAHDVQAELRSQRLLSEIVKLSHMFYEDHERALDTASCRGAMAFVRDVDATMPFLSADSDGLVIAEWRSAEGSIALRFLSRNKFHYALAIRDGTKTHRPWGTGDSNGLLSKHRQAGAIIRSEQASL